MKKSIKIPILKNTCWWLAYMLHAYAPPINGRKLSPDEWMREAKQAVASMNCGSSKRKRRKK